MFVLLRISYEKILSEASGSFIYVSNVMFVFKMSFHPGMQLHQV